MSGSAVRTSTRRRCRAAARAGSTRRARAERRPDRRRRASRAGAGERREQHGGQVEERRKRSGRSGSRGARKRRRAVIWTVRGRGGGGAGADAGAGGGPSARPCRPPRRSSTRGSTRRARPRRRRGGCAWSCSRDEAARSRRAEVKEVEEQVRAAAWRQTQAHQAEMAQRDAAHQAQLEAARQEVQQARASASSAGTLLEPGAGVVLRRGVLSRRRGCDLTRCEVGLRQHIELLREHEQLQRWLADAQRKSEGEGDRRLRHGCDLEIRVSRERSSSALCSSVSALLGHTGRANAEAALAAEAGTETRGRQLRGHVRRRGRVRRRRADR